MSHVDCSSRQRLSQDFWQGAFWSEATESAAPIKLWGLGGEAPGKCQDFILILY